MFRFSAFASILLFAFLCVDRNANGQDTKASAAEQLISELRLTGWPPASTNYFNHDLSLTLVGGFLNDVAKPRKGIFLGDKPVVVPKDKVLVITQIEVTHPMALPNGTVLTPRIVSSKGEWQQNRPATSNGRPVFDSEGKSVPQSPLACLEGFYKSPHADLQEFLYRHISGGSLSQDELDSLKEYHTNLNSFKDLTPTIWDIDRENNGLVERKVFYWPGIPVSRAHRIDVVSNPLTKGDLPDRTDKVAATVTVTLRGYFIEGAELVRSKDVLDLLRDTALPQILRDEMVKGYEAKINELKKQLEKIEK